jgi:hypothetical protein
MKESEIKMSQLSNLLFNSIKLLDEKSCTKLQ